MVLARLHKTTAFLPFFVAVLEVIICDDVKLGGLSPVSFSSHKATSFHLRLKLREQKKKSQRAKTGQYGGSESMWNEIHCQKLTGW